MASADPYTIPGTACLRNLLGITDPDLLAVAESRVVAVREVALSRETLPGEYDLNHLRAFHRYLFRDVYDWAGTVRTVDIAKGTTQFGDARFVADDLRGVLRALHDEDRLCGLDRAAFVDRLAHYYGEVNARHVFREGNGRTQRAFFRQLGAAAGWRLDWSVLRRAAHDEACAINSRTADAAPLVVVLAPAVTPLVPGAET